MIAALRPLFLALCFASCAGPSLLDPPQYSVETPLGKGFAHSQERASHLVDTWMRLAQEIEGDLPAAKRDEKLDVWLMSAEEIPDPFQIGHPMGGITYSRNGDAWLIQVPDTHKFEWILSHELTHALLDEDWHTLGGTLEEGLCEYVASMQAPHLLPMRMLQVHMGAAALFGRDDTGIFFSQATRTDDGDIQVRWIGEKGKLPDEVWTIDRLRYYLEQESIAPFPEVRAGLQRVGTFLVFRMVERQGLPGLLQLCRQAKAEGHHVLPFDWVMRAAGFDPSPHAQRGLRDQLSDALLEPLQARHMKRTLDRYPVEIGEYIASEYAAYFPDYDGDHFVEFSHGTVRTSDGVRIRLFGLQALRNATRYAWPVREHTAEVIQIPPYAARF